MNERGVENSESVLEVISHHFIGYQYDYTPSSCERR